MCLTRTDSKRAYLKTKSKVITCYKLVERSGMTPCYLQQLHIGGNFAYYGVKIRADNGRYYQSGFHCMLSKRGAEKWAQVVQPYEKIIKVKVHKKDVVAVGFQNRYRTIVAEVIYIEKGEL